jgi:hypothetical protein
MYISISQSTLAQAHDVTTLEPEAVAQLIEGWRGAVVIGIFPVPHFASSRWVHVLRGRVENDQQHVEVLKFAASMASFQTRQALRRRERERDQQLPECHAAAAE